MLAEEITREFPELERYVDEVIETTGGGRGKRQPVKDEAQENIEVD